jgi:hypothetical protein
MSLFRFESNSRSAVGRLAALTHAVVLTTAVLPHPKIVPPAPCEPDPKENEVCLDMGAVPGTVIAGRSFDFPIEGPIIEFLALADVPAIVCGKAVVALGRPSMSPWTESYVTAGSWILIGSIEWWLIGAWAQKKMGVLATWRE